MNDTGLPPRAALLSPPPVPAAEPESFESRLKRTCTFNQLRVGSVVSQLVLPRHITLGVLGSKMNQPFHLLSLGGKVSKDWSHALESLVEKGLFRGATWQELLPEGVVPTARATLQWCPDCYELDTSQPHGPYERLLWTATEVVVCPRHQRALIDTCSHCGGKNFRPLTADQCSGFCPLCLTWLGNITPRTGTQVLDNYALWIAEGLARVIGSAWKSKYVDQSNKNSVVDGLLDKHFGGVGATMAKALGRSKTTIWTWLATGVTSFESRLELSYIFDIELQDFLLERKMPVRASKFHQERAVDLANRRTPRKARTSCNLDEVELFLSAIADGAYPELMTIEQICTALKTDRKMLSRHFPDAMRALSLKLSARRAEIREVVRSDRLGDLTRAVRYVVRAHGPWVKRRKLFEEVSKLVDPVQRHEAELVWSLATQRQHITRLDADFCE